MVIAQVSFCPFFFFFENFDISSQYFPKFSILKMYYGIWIPTLLKDEIFGYEQVQW